MTSSPKIRIVQLTSRLESVGSSRTILDILTRSDPAKYEFFLIAGRIKKGVVPYKGQAAFALEMIPDLAKSYSWTSALNLVFHLSRILREWKPDILHVHSIQVGWIGALAGRLAGVPAVIYSSYGLPKLFKRKRRRLDLLQEGITGMMMKIPALLSDLIITVTPHGLEEELALRLASRAKYRVIYNAIQPERLEGQENSEISKYQMGFENYFPILGTATRLDREKGMEFLLEAAAHLKNAFPDLLLLVMGDGPIRENLIVLAKRLGITNQVRFLGLREDVPRILRVLDIFVLPSLYEATGIVLAEAMACGKPVVTTRVGGLPQLIQEGEDGFFVPPGDSLRLAEKIARVARDKDLARRMGEKGAAKARQLFDMRKMVSDYEGLYQELLKKKKKIR